MTIGLQVIWSKSKPDVEFQYGGRLREFHGMSSQSHVSHCRVLPLGEFSGGAKGGGREGQTGHVSRLYNLVPRLCPGS